MLGWRHVPETPANGGKWRREDPEGTLASQSGQVGEIHAQQETLSQKIRYRASTEDSRHQLWPSRIRAHVKADTTQAHTQLGGSDQV